MSQLLFLIISMMTLSAFGSTTRILSTDTLSASSGTSISLGSDITFTGATPIVSTLGGTTSQPLIVQSGNTTTGSSGGVTVGSGDNATSGGSGNLTLRTGTVVSGTRGSIIVSATNLNMGSANITNLSDPNSSQDAATKAYVDTKAPLTTKGDLLSYSTVPARLPVGTDGQFLTADSTQTLGVKWAGVSVTYGQETPTGAINGSNTSFTLAFTPVSNASVLVFLNGAEQDQTVDYTISSATITMTTAPAIGQTMKVFYTH